uniref:Retrotransposon gag domain-containing protein n=1 Tax=Panagrolaimus sp. ES5 TaxID=591445 RepID=A0AC34G5X0_9BILA
MKKVFNYAKTARRNAKENNKIKEAEPITTTVITNRKNEIPVPPDSANTYYATVLPIFGGKQNESVMTFIDQMVINTLNLHEHEKLELLKYRLYGKAAEKVHKYASTQQLSWKSVITFLENEFPEPNSIFEEQQCYNCGEQQQQQQQQNLQKYANDIKKKINKEFCNRNGFTKAKRNQLMIERFIHGLRKPIKQQLQQELETFTSLEMILNRAMEMQQHYGSPSK